MRRLPICLKRQIINDILETATTAMTSAEISQEARRRMWNISSREVVGCITKLDSKLCLFDIIEGNPNKYKLFDKL